MRVAKKQSIGRKITFVVLSAVIASVISATGFFLWRQTTDALEIRHQQLTAVANVFSSVISKHVENNDRTQTLIALRAIGKMPSIPFAVVTRNDNSTLAVLGSAIILTNEEKPQANSAADRFSQKKSVFSLLRSTTLPVSVPVINSGAKVGTLLLLADVSDLRKSLLEGFLIALLTVVIACVLGMSIASKMIRKITKPIRHLAWAMSNVQKTHDFSTRVKRESDDETGQLVDSFNEMLSQISQRDESLAVHRENLEQTVEERTRELVVAKNVAEEANMAKSDFLATMSHEIRTPMNGVMVMAELLAAGNLLPRQQRYAEVIVRSGQSLLTIINDILDLSKIEAGKLELEQVPVSPAGIIDDVVSLFWQRAAGKGIDIASFVDKDVPTKIVGDPVRLNQVLSNLVNNALKFTETGYVAISVKTIKNVSTGQSNLEFSVIDTGIGIAADKISTVFQEFTQADQTTTRQFGGTGLGLSICKKLVAAMDGHVDVESVLYKGSRFYFNIPVEVVETAPAMIDCAGSKMSRAIVALDGLASKQSLMSYLHANNVEVSQVHPAKISEADFSRIDAVFSCSQALEKLHGSLPPKDRPFVIAVSQLGDVGAEDLVRRGEADDLIMRPVGRVEMFDMIARLARGVPRGINAVTQATQKRAALPQFASARILIADDNAVNREVIIEVLRQLGVKAQVAKDGIEAVEVWQRNEFDLIFMDCSMPVMDGYQATVKIREMEKALAKKRTPVIALTAHIAGDNAQKWRNAGMDDFITKPFTIKTIAERMGLLLPESAPTEGPDLSQVVEPVAVPVQVVEVVSAAQEDELPVLDDDVLADLAESGGGSDSLIKRVLQLFTDHAPASFEDIKKTSTDEDKQALADAAHALKSMCANIGAAKAAAACHVLELAVRTGQEIDVGAAIAEISATMNEALVEIRQLQVG